MTPNQIIFQHLQISVPLFFDSYESSLLFLSRRSFHYSQFVKWVPETSSGGSTNQ
jgi:hypothetical protein